MRMIRSVRTGIAAFVTAVLSIAIGAAPAYATVPTMMLSSAVGPTGGGNTMTATVGGNVLAFPAGTNPVVQFQFYGTGATTCGSTAKDVTQIDGTASALTAGILTVDPSAVRRISTTKIAFTVPAVSYPDTVNGSPSDVNTTGLALVNGQSTARWNVCVYDSDSTTNSTLLATSAYTLAVRPTITAILPARGPAGGGQAITVNGTGFGTSVTAAIDGHALTNVQLAANGSSFTATTPAHAPGTGNWLVVNTSGGPVSSSDPDNNGLPEDNDGGTLDAPIPFAFDNSITITPNTAAVGDAPYIDLRGAGFTALTFDQTGAGAPTDPIAHVFLVRDAYNEASNRGVQECSEVIVLDDTELICRLDLGADSLDPSNSAPQDGVPIDVGTYTLTVVADGSTGASEPDPTLVTSGATFTVAPY